MEKHRGRLAVAPTIAREAFVTRVIERRAMSPSIWTTHANLVRQILRQIRHDAFVRRHSVKQDDVTLRRSRYRFTTSTRIWQTRGAGKTQQRLYGRKLQEKSNASSASPASPNHSFSASSVSPLLKQALACAC